MWVCVSVWLVLMGGGARAGEEEEEGSEDEWTQEPDLLTNHMFKTARKKIVDIENKIETLRSLILDQAAAQGGRFPALLNQSAVQTAKPSKEDIERAVTTVIDRADDVFTLTQSERATCIASERDHSKEWECNTESLEERNTSYRHLASQVRLLSSKPCNLIGFVSALRRFVVPALDLYFLAPF